MGLGWEPALKEAKCRYDGWKFSLPCGSQMDMREQCGARWHLVTLTLLAACEGGGPGKGEQRMLVTSRLDVCPFSHLYSKVTCSVWESM